MQDKIQELKAVLLFVLFSFVLCLEGCTRSGDERYVAGPETEVSAQKETEYPDSGDSDDASDTGHRANANSRSESETAAPETEGYVYVCGAVCHPGVYPIHQGMRVFEAIELAGGFSADADGEWLNQAGHLQDGQQLYIYSKTETQQMKTPEMAWNADTAVQQTETAGIINGKVNLNTADVETLMTLPGIGEVKAEAIVRYRTEHGAFSSIEEIQNIPGIKQAVFSKIEDRITV